MEDAPRLAEGNYEGRVCNVLILVVMEDAPRPLSAGRKPSWKKCLNPCCNGRCCPTSTIILGDERDIVLILVVMEDAPRLKHVFSVRSTDIVLILVVMEDAPRLSRAASLKARDSAVLILVVMKDAPRLWQKVWWRNPSLS